MRILQVGVPFTIVGRSRKSWIRWNRYSFRGCDATLRAHSGISQQTSPEYGSNVCSTYNKRVNVGGEQRRVRQFLLPNGSRMFSLKPETMIVR
jgi:hypothetical protein